MKKIKEIIEIVWTEMTRKFDANDTIEIDAFERGEITL